MTGRVRGAILAGLSAALTAIFYGRAFRFDLQCDDLLVIRPWSRAELAAVWHGTWEPTHAFATFFRPVATWFYAGTFELFGWNAPAHMLLSLAMLALLAWLLGVFVMRESGSAFAGGIAIAWYLAHPNVPWSTGTWVTNEFHKLTAISALCALLVWQRVRARPATHWVWLAPLILICFLVKEDGLMLIPALLSIQWLRARLVRDVKPPSPSLVAGAVAFAAALVAWRYFALRELGGFPLPTTAYAVVHNLTRGPLYAFTLHGSLSVLTVFEKLTAAAMALFVALGLALMPREKRFLPLAGLALMFWYDLPLALISNVMRYYMLTIASVIVVAPVFRAWNDQPVYRLAAAVPIAMLIFVNGGMKRQQTELDLFAPCQRLEHDCVAWNLEENPTLPPEARPYIADTATQCGIHPDDRPKIGEAHSLTWGLGPTVVDTVTGTTSWEVRGDVTTLIPLAHRWASISVRHADATPARPVTVTIVSGGRKTVRQLTSPEWSRIEIETPGGVRDWLRNAHRVDTMFSSPGAEFRVFIGTVS